MDIVALYDAKNRLSELCNKVSETGEPCVISRRGKPVVKLVPIDANYSSDSVWGTVAESQAKYGPIEDEFELPERSSAMSPSPLDE